MILQIYAPAFSYTSSCQGGAAGEGAGVRVPGYSWQSDYLGPGHGQVCQVLVLLLLCPGTAWPDISVFLNTRDWWSSSCARWGCGGLPQLLLLPSPRWELCTARCTSSPNTRPHSSAMGSWDTGSGGHFEYFEKWRRHKPRAATRVSRIIDLENSG